MRLRPVRAREHRLAFYLAFLALLAQLWLWQISTTHQLRLAAMGPAEICTTSPRALPVVALHVSEDGKPSADLCPVCSSAATTSVPLGPAHVPQATAVHGPACALQAIAAPRSSPAGLRPPARAPPLA